MAHKIAKPLPCYCQRRGFAVFIKTLRIGKNKGRERTCKLGRHSVFPNAMSYPYCLTLKT
ncbi:hypothetical protein C7N43_36015 [Sphingobacteriales bacterium UPWRP_1]|nr:hypothetical protein C7N43_36015 [Sphingobacteriales bacterium UPWRP_1]